MTEPRIHATCHVRPALQRPAGPFRHERIVGAVHDIGRDRQRTSLLQHAPHSRLLVEERKAESRRRAVHGQRVGEICRLHRGVAGERAGRERVRDRETRGCDAEDVREHAFPLGHGRVDRRRRQHEQIRQGARRFCERVAQRERYGRRK